MNKILIASTFVLTAALSVSVLAAGFNGSVTVAKNTNNGSVAVATGSGFNGSVSPQTAGGFKGPGLQPSTVKQALSFSDDTPVVLIGKIERSLGDEKYLFTDKSGSVTVEIDNDDWRGITVTPNDTIIIEGEVDKDFFKTEIDVERVTLKK